MTDHIPSSRLPMPDPADMSSQQRAIYDQAMRFFGAPIGPRIALISTPDVGRAWSDLLTELEKSALPKSLWELSILMVARHWHSDFEWWAHERKALAAGVTADAVEAIREGRVPAFDTPAAAATYAYVRSLLVDRRVSAEVHGELRALIGTRELVELTVLVGHYSNVAMTLVAHDVGLPGGVEPPLPAAAALA